jgi:hypothetical protein
VSAEQVTRAGRSSGPVAAAAPTFDLDGFAHALTTGDIGHQLARYAAAAEVRVTTDTSASNPRVVSGAQAISAWLHELTSADAPCVVSHLLDGGDRVAFTQHWRHPDGRDRVATSTAELQDALITTQHTILVTSRQT